MVTGVYYNEVRYQFPRTYPDQVIAMSDLMTVPGIVFDHGHFRLEHGPGVVWRAQIWLHHQQW